MLNPRVRVRLAWSLLVFSLVGWAATHALMVILAPPEASWVFHVLLALSWFSPVLTALVLLATTDVRKQQGDGGGG